MSINRIFLILISINFLSVLTLFWSIHEYSASIEEISKANYQRAYSYLLADELRQSSDDLTRLGRTYVVTGDVSYKQQYLDILAIRNGKKPRPENYHRIYWDFVAAGEVKPRPDTETISLQKLMQNAGFTDVEFEKLKKAQANSDGLVNLEVEAMNLVEGKDAEGHETGVQNFEKARQLVHSQEYHTYKAQIMKPIDEFFVLLENRTQARIDAAEANSSSYLIKIIISCVSLIVTLVTMIFYLLLRVVNGLSILQSVMGSVTDGDLDVEIPENRNDEIGTMFDQVKLLRNAMIEKDIIEQQQEENRLELNKEKRSLMNNLANEIETNIGNIISSVFNASQSLKQASTEMSDIAAKGNEQAVLVSRSSEESDSSIQHVAASSEEMATSISEISKQVQEASVAAKYAVEKVSDTGSEMSNLGLTVDKIGEVVSMISDIADQTNLLALNATIESARAGEAGRGFAVVAAEVKDLASQTTAATDQISRQIEDVQSATLKAVNSINGISESIKSLESTSTVLASVVEEQDAVTREIVNSAQIAAGGSRNVSTNMSYVASSSDQTGKISMNVMSSATQLTQQAEKLKKEMKNFIEQIRAA